MGGGVVVLTALALSACGRAGDGSGDGVTKITSAVVTTTPPVLTVSAGTTVYVAQAAAVVVDPNLSLTISDGSDLLGAQVSISTGYVAGQDVLSFTAQSGVTGTFATGTGILTLSGQAPVTTYQAILRTVTYINTAGAAPNTQARAVTFSAGTSSLFYPGTGHYYEYVNTNLNWVNAKTAAAALTYYGLQGYLATVTSAGENTFINGKLVATGWIGASDAAVEGQWRWVTGPEGVGAGTLFFTGQGASGTVVPGAYANWNPGEPNNSGGAENWAQFYVGGLWNDLPITSTLGSVVEFGGMPGDPTLQLSGTKNLTVSLAPTFTITASAGANGAIAPAGVSTVIQGQSQAFTITPSTSYTIASVLVDGVSVGAVATYTFSNVTVNHTISATFAAPLITVSAGNNQTALTGATFGSTLAVLVTTAAGTPLAATAVLFAAPAAGASATVAASAITNASGIASVTATANAMAGAYAVTATVSGTSATTTFSLRNLGAPSSISVVSGSGQSAALLGVFATTLTALVSDSTGFALPNVVVTFSPPASGASAGVSATTVTTNAMGRASVTATANTVAGSYNVNATAPSVGTPAAFALTNLAGAASLVTLVSGSPQTATVGAGFGAPIIVRVTDASSNPIAGATVTFSAPAPGSASATLGSPTAVTNASGLAQTAAAANTFAGSYAVSASIPAGASVSAMLTNAAGPPGAITVSSGGGQIALIGAAFTQPLAARVVDGNGNPVGGATVTFLAPTSGASATLGAASATTNASGVASVTAAANATAGNYTVSASVSGVVMKAAFTLTNQAPITLSPASAAVAPRGSVTFAAAGGSGTGYVFAIQSAPSGGSIDPTTGVYTAGTVALVTDVVTVTDNQAHTVHANVTVGAALSLSSTPNQVPPRGPAVFSTAGGSGTGLIYAISTNRSGGTIDASGHYIAGQNDSVTDVISVTDSVGNTATASIVVGAGVALTASATQTPPRGTLTFSASGGSGAGFVFAMGADASGGTINSASGVYVAGGAFGVTDVVTVTDSLGNVAAANVTVGAGVTVAPAAPSIAPRGTLTLSASGGSGSGYSFAIVTNASGGTIDVVTGVYVAGGTPSSTDLVTVTDSLGNSGTASVSVGGGIAVSPSSLTTPPRGSQAFVASGGNGAGYVFTLTSHPSGGTVDAATGAYTAGAVGSATDVLSVVDPLGNHSTVTITVGPGLAVTPTTATVSPLGQQALSVSGGTGSGYNFTLSSDPSGGGIDPLTGLYTAGVIGNVADVVTVLDALGNTATATITVTASLVAATGTVSAAPRATVTVAVTGGAPPYVFSISSNGSGGSIDPATGAYTAGSNPDSTDVILIADHNGAVTTVVVDVGRGVAISPAQPATAPLGSIAFGATNGSGTGYVFALADNQSGGSIVPGSGAYTAGAKGAVADLVTVTDSLGNSASVSIAVGGHLVLGPAGATVAPREKLTLVAFAGSGTGFVYALSDNQSGGSVDPASGVYTAGLVPNVTDVLTVTDSLAATATVAVSVGPGLTVLPPSASTAPLGTIQLTSAGGSGTGYLFTLSTDGSTGGVSPSGLYTAGPTGGTTDVVTVTDSLGNTDTVTVTVGPGMTLTASDSLVPPRGTTTFVALGGVGGGYTFTLHTNGSGGNIVATTGVYTAGDTGSSADVIEATDPFGNSATLTIHVGPGVSITPPALAAPPGGTLTLLAAGGSGTGYVYTFTTNASGGTLDATTGLYGAGSVTDVLDGVRATDSLGNTASATISVGGALTVNPAAPTVSPRGHLAFTAIGGGGTGFTFVLTTNTSGGSIGASTGSYTAGSTGNVQDVVTVTDTLHNSAHVTITVGDGVHITPSAVNTAPLAKMTFTVSGGSGTGYSFTLTGNTSHGTIDANTGAYTAGALGGGTDVVTVTDALGNTATAQIHVAAALAATVATATSPPRGTLTIAASGGAGPLMYALTTNGSGGGINATTGVYTAGAVGSTTDLVTVTDANRAAVTVTVQVGPGPTIAPVAGPVQTGQQKTLAASGGSGTGFVWSVLSSGSGGTIVAATGAYTAGSHLGSDVILVTDSLGNTAEITVPVVASTAKNSGSSGCGCELASGFGSTTGTLAVTILLALGLLLAARRRRPSAARRP
jgi:Big-like domain-containing protein